MDTSLPSSPIRLNPNPTGIQPTEYRCLVLLHPVNDKIGSIILTDENRQRTQAAETFATLIAVGGNAFEDWKGTIPEAGDTVIVSKYSGQPPKAGEIENLYRLCNDKDIIAVIGAPA
jgi:co-chaperonin GroES (HSP10)